MAIKRYDICKPIKYPSQGGEKTYWANVGEMVEFEKKDGSGINRIIKIYAIGLEANVFPQKPKNTPRNDGNVVDDNNNGSDPKHAVEGNSDATTGDIKAEDIPF